VKVWEWEEKNEKEWECKNEMENIRDWECTHETTMTNNDDIC